MLLNAGAVWNQPPFPLAWGPEHTSTLAMVNNLGLLYANQGKMAEAEEMYVRALRGYEKAWGPEHTSTLDTVNNRPVLRLLRIPSNPVVENRKRLLEMVLAFSSSISRDSCRYYSTLVATGSFEDRGKLLSIHPSYF
jgi:hypothetical protein